MNPCKTATLVDTVRADATKLVQRFRAAARAAARVWREDGRDEGDERLTEAAKRYVKYAAEVLDRTPAAGGFPIYDAVTGNFMCREHFDAGAKPRPVIGAHGLPIAWSMQTGGTPCNSPMSGEFNRRAADTCEPVAQQAGPPASPTWTTEGGLPFYDDDGRLERREPFEPTNDGRKPRYVPNRLGLPSTWVIPLR